MTEKQEHLLQLFRELDEICKKNNLRYVMAGGTASVLCETRDLFPGMMMWTSICPEMTGTNWWKFPDPCFRSTAPFSVWT